MEAFLVAFITSVCKIDKASVSRDTKTECIDFMVNCITDQPSLDKCRTRYNNGERYQEQE